MKRRVTVRVVAGRSSETLTLNHFLVERVVPQTIDTAYSQGGRVLGRRTLRHSFRDVLNLGPLLSMLRPHSYLAVVTGGRNA